MSLTLLIFTPIISSLIAASAESPTATESPAAVEPPATADTISVRAVHAAITATCLAWLSKASSGAINCLSIDRRFVASRSHFDSGELHFDSGELHSPRSHHHHHLHLALACFSLILALLFALLHKWAQFLLFSLNICLPHWFA